MLGKIEGGRKRGRQDEMVGRHHQLNGHILDGLRELVMGREAWHAVVHRVTKSWTWLSKWTELIFIFSIFVLFQFCFVNYFFKQAFPLLISPQPCSPLFQLVLFFSVWTLLFASGEPIFRNFLFLLTYVLFQIGFFKCFLFFFGWGMFVYFSLKCVCVVAMPFIFEVLYKYWSYLIWVTVVCLTSTILPSCVTWWVVELTLE